MNIKEAWKILNLTAVNGLHVEAINSIQDEMNKTTPKVLAQKILNVLNSDCEDSELSDAFEKEFKNDPMWYIYYLAASAWSNDLESWCKMIVSGKSEEEFFGSNFELIDKLIKIED